MKQAPAHINFLDHLRGVAILSVFVYHCLQPTFLIMHPPWSGFFRDMNVGTSYLCVFPASFGWAGVAIFFALSGFCIHLSHERSREKGFRVFFIRRFFRIYPPYLVALCFFAIFNIVIHEEPLREEIRQFVPHVVLLQNLNSHFYSGINGAFWSIAVEVQLYLLYPLMVWFASRLGWQRALWIPALTEMVSREIASVIYTFDPFDPSRLLTGSPLYFWFSWSIGAALADAYLKGEPLPFRNFLAFVWPVLFIGSYFFKPFYPYFFILAALSTTCLMSFLLSRPTLNSPPNGAWKYALGHLRWAGIVSYSAYLIHIPLLNHVPNFLSLIFPHHNFSHLVMYGICLLSWFPIFGLSYLFYRYMEQPSIAWGKALIERSRKPSPAAPQLATEPAP
jgi:peptidoglycan/LPS O-acetylase OafA/YrhL